MTDTRSPGFPRRDFLKAGGAMVIGFTIAPPSLAQNPGQVTGAPSGSAQPDADQLDTWIAIHADNTATIIIGHHELGQGISTTLLQIAAEELDLDMAQVKSLPLETGKTPNQGLTAASAGIARGGVRIRLAAADARQALLNLASTRLGASVDRLTVARGVVSVAGNAAQSVTYGQLLGERQFNVPFTGRAPIKDYRTHTIVGTSVPRRDLPAKAAGKHVYLQHVRVDGMLHGRVVRPRGQGSFFHGARVMSLDADSIRDIPGARVVRRGDFVGVVAPDEWSAVRAAERLRVTWDMPAVLGTQPALYDRMRAAQTIDRIVLDRGECTAAFARAAHVASGRYDSPYQMHGPMAPNCAIADVKADSAAIFTSRQSIYLARERVAAVLGLPPGQITVRFFESSPSFGRGCQEDVTQAAAVMSQEVGAPVRLQFMRWDEHGWDHYQQAHTADVKIACDAAGKIVAYEYHGWQHAFTSGDTTEILTGLRMPGDGGDGVRAQAPTPFNAGDQYTIPNWRIVNHRVPGMRGYFKAAPLRSPLDVALSFGGEQVIDEVAYKANLDPHLFRRQNINGERWLGVLEAVAKASNWTPRRAASVQQSGRIRRGRGVALGTHLSSYGGAVAEIEVDTQTGVIVAKRMFGAVDPGQVINPGIVERQIEAQMCHAASRMLKEEVTFSTTNVTSLDWASYPVLRFGEAPETTAVVVNRPDVPSSGAGEEALAAGAAAIANAFFDATGVRMHAHPLTPARVLAALRQA